MDRDRGDSCPLRTHPLGPVPRGDGPAPLPGVAGRRARSLAMALVAALSALAAPWPLPAGSAGAAVSGGPALTVTSQSNWVTPGRDFDLRLALGPGLPAVSDLGVDVAVYPCLSSRSSFDQTVDSATPDGTPEDQTTAPVAWSAIATGSSGADLHIGLDVADEAPAPATGETFVASLHCSAADGAVFPVHLDLVDLGSGASLGTLTTHAIYLSSPGPHPLVVAWELPIATATPAAAPLPAASVLAGDPTAALATPAASTLSGLDSVVATVQALPGVAVSLAPSPQAVTQLVAAGHAATVSAIAALAVSPSHAVPRQTYVPVDAAALVGAGLPGELDAQLGRGAAVLAKEGVPATANIWVARSRVDAPTAAALAARSFTDVVVPLSQAPSTTTGSTVRPYSLTGSGLTAVGADPILTQRFTSDPADPVLAAHQLVAELTQIYLEAPNSGVRAVVAIPPADWRPDPTFVRTLFEALNGNPVLAPTTLGGLFATLAPETDGPPATTTSLAGPLPAAAIGAQRARLAAFASAAGPGAGTKVVALGDNILGAESDGLRPAQQAAAVGAAAAATDAQVGLVSVPSGQSITLTSRSGRIPVTVVSDAPYPVQVSLELRSDKLVFDGTPNQWTTPMILRPGNTNVKYVSVLTRASGNSGSRCRCSRPRAGWSSAAGSSPSSRP